MIKFIFLALFLGLTLSQKTCIKSLTDKQRNLTVVAHNTYRQKVASGGQSPLPQATNMLEIVWDSDVENLAQGWTNTDPQGHNPNRKVSVRPKDYIGENIYWESRWSSAPLTPGNFDITKAVNAWYSEVKGVPASLVDKFGQTSSVVGHFTQIIWADTGRVGCGVLDCVTKKTSTSYQQDITVVCDYEIGGNWLGSPIYVKGAKASKCTKTSEKYSSLCAKR